MPEDCVPPEISDHLRFYYSAFADLETDRAVGFGVGPIPWSSLDRYCRRFGIHDIDEFEWFSSLIRVMESESFHQRKKD